MIKRLLDLSVSGKEVIHRDSPDSIALVQTLAYFERLQGRGEIGDDTCIAFRVPGAFRRIRSRLLSKEDRKPSAVQIDDEDSYADKSQDELFASTLDDISAEQIVAEIQKILSDEPECRVKAFILDCLAIPLNAISAHLNNHLGINISPVTLRQWRKRYFLHYCELVRAECASVFDSAEVA